MSKKSIIIVSLIILGAICGVVMINVGTVSADMPANGTVEQGVAATQTEQSSFSGASAWGPLVKMLSALILVIFCAYGALWLLKRTMNRNRGARGRQARLEVIDSTFVAPKKSVSLVKVGDRSVLVGVTDQQISVLTELSCEETEKMLADDAPVDEANGFGRLLKSATDRLKSARALKKPAALEA